MKSPYRNKQVRELNQIIHAENLYSGHSRFIDARLVKDVVTVENLQTGERVPFVNDGSFRNGRGTPVVLAAQVIKLTGRMVECSPATSASWSGGAR